VRKAVKRVALLTHEAISIMQTRLTKDAGARDCEAMAGAVVFFSTIAGGMLIDQVHKE
jgi:hypothetical protein